MKGILIPTFLQTEHITCTYLPLFKIMKDPGNIQHLVLSKKTWNSQRRRDLSKLRHTKQDL